MNLELPDMKYLMDCGVCSGPTADEVRRAQRARKHACMQRLQDQKPDMQYLMQHGVCSIVPGPTADDIQRARQRACMQRLRDRRRAMGQNAHGQEKKDPVRKKKNLNDLRIRRLLAGLTISGKVRQRDWPKSKLLQAVQNNNNQNKPNG